MKKTSPGSAANNKRYKDYYLKDIIQFIVLFMKNKHQNSNLNTKENDKQNSETDIITDIDQHNSKVFLDNKIPSTLKFSKKASRYVIR